MIPTRSMMPRSPNFASAALNAASLTFLTIHLCAEIIEGGFILLHALRPSSGAEVDEDLTVEAALDGQRIVRTPLIRLRPLAGRDHDGELAQSGRQRAVVAHV